ncbi:Arylamine N-acetyltransferase [Leucoagaricus sp. SymC.cos]|nr:Arylamine N-acetyltransferase [Leucoagaricus sp. SymC.cos]
MARPGLLQDGLLIRKIVSLYSPEQVSAWLKSMQWSQSYTAYELAEGKFPTTLRNLAALVRCHAVTFPYENLQMHYSKDHTMDVDPQCLFRRLLTDRRGSYCFGLNILFLWMLRGLGYRAYPGLGRVNENGDPKMLPEFSGCSHMVIFVQLGEESNATYIVDVGCGGSGPTMPILLSDAEDNIVMGTTPTEKHRLRREEFPGSSIGIVGCTESREWVMEVMHEKPELKDSVQWRIVYTFSEREVFQADLEVLNRGRYTEPTGFFADQVICSIHHWLEDDAELNIHPSERRLVRVGLMGRLLKKFVGSSSEFLKLVYTEDERVEVYRKYFNIDLSREEVECIRGRRAAI